MKPVKVIRVERLEALIKEYGGVERVARLARQNASYLSQCRSGHRGMGDRVARSIEENIGLPSGWMDSSDAGSPADYVPTELLLFRKLTPDQREALLVLLRGMLDSKQS